ncbi:MAG TPA: PAS domain S-box protein [Fibrobacteria bacterium]|nr:PAS domain S-box protein [Fibrobacteria bacterium]
MRPEAGIPESSESEARFRTMADCAPVLIWMAGVDAECVFFNRGWLEFTGRPLEAELGVGWAEGVHFEDFQNCMQAYLGSFSARKPFRMEYRMRRADGRFRWVLDTGVPRFETGGIFAGFIGSCIDITDIREANEALSRNAGQLEIRVQDRNRELEASNRELERFNRLMVNRELKMIELKKQVNALSAELGRAEPYGIPADKVPGGAVPEGNAPEGKDAAEELAAQRAAALNLAGDAEAARQKAEKAQAQFRALLEAAPDAMVVADRRGDIVLINGQTRRLFGFEREELLGRSVELLMPEKPQGEGRQGGLFNQARLKEMGSGYEVTALRKDGGGFPAEVSLSPMESEDGILVIAAIRDMTERKSAEESIRKSLLEKEALLKEIHHRVKNNLQIISSLLRLQAERIVDKRDLAMLRESEERVNSMSLIHEMLYQSKDLARVNFGGYVRNLTAELLQTYATGSARIDLDLQVETLELDINRAIPLGLIINELVSNALKYAFPGTRSGTLSVRLASASGELTLEVRDDGIGLPPDFQERRKSSLGLQIVESLCRQVGGRHAFEGEKGTRFRMSAPI